MQVKNDPTRYTFDREHQAGPIHDGELQEPLTVRHHDLAGGTALHLREGVIHERVRARL